MNARGAAFWMFPFLDLRDYRSEWLPRDLAAAFAVLFVTIPQGMAYALIAGLPPAAGLYAAGFPAIAGSLLRSARFPITGPTNAVSLVVGSAIAMEGARSGASPTEVGLTLALLVGAIQIGAGALRLHVVSHYVSTPVLRGYLTGAAVLIAAGQLPNATGTAPTVGTLVERLAGWAATLPHVQLLDVGTALAAMGIVAAARRVDRRLPGAILALVATAAAAAWLDLADRGLHVLGGLATPAGGSPVIGLPERTWPRLGATAWEILPAAFACAMLSAIESSSIARAIGTAGRDRLDLRAELTGVGVANVVASLGGGYPVSASPIRSLINRDSGARSRLSGALAGALLLATLPWFGPLVSRIPVAALAGILFVIAFDLVDRPGIRAALRGTWGDAIAFTATLVGTWTLPLDRALYLGVGISIVLFLRRARMLTVRELAITSEGRFREVTAEGDPAEFGCSAIRVLNVTGPLFFAAAGELESRLERFARNQDIRVLVVRLRQARGLDVSVAEALSRAMRRLRDEGRETHLVGLDPAMMELLERTGIADDMTREHIWTVEDDWRSAMVPALAHALRVVGPHECGNLCPVARYVAADERDAGVESSGE